MGDMADGFETILYGKPADHVVRICLNRPEKANAQNTLLLHELNSAFDRAARDNAVKVVILAGAGRHFSAGHDLRESPEEADPSRFEPVGTWCGFGSDGQEGPFQREKEIYQGFSERWRNFSKPTIAEVHGLCVAGGLMLVWPCDIIVCSEDARFMDNAVDMGIPGVEFFAHPWELGPRKAKEFLFTADMWDAREAHRLGMVNHVVKREDLEGFTLDLARRIARKPLFALKAAKEAVNNAQDAAGRTTVMNAQFALHHLCHSHNMQKYGMSIDPNSDGARLMAGKAKSG